MYFVLGTCSIMSFAKLTFLFYFNGFFLKTYFFWASHCCFCFLSVIVQLYLKKWQCGFCSRQLNTENLFIIHCQFCCKCSRGFTWHAIWPYLIILRRWKRTVINKILKDIQYISSGYPKMEGKGLSQKGKSLCLLQWEYLIWISLISLLSLLLA